jgi:hypothetical protein
MVEARRRGGDGVSPLVSHLEGVMITVRRKGLSLSHLEGVMITVRRRGLSLSHLEVVDRVANFVRRHVPHKLSHGARPEGQAG